MTFINLINTIGIAAVLGAFLYIGKKLQVLDKLAKDVENIKFNLKIVTDYLTSTHNDFNHAELRAYSPFRLTPKGTELIRKTQFDTIFKENAEDFCTIIDSEQPRLKYDVELAAIKAILALSNKQYMDILKVYFYNSNRSFRNVAPTLGVYIRDKYLKLHPEIVE